MKLWTATALLGLMAIGACRSSGLVDILGIEPEQVIKLIGADSTAADSDEGAPEPCGVTPSKKVTDVTETCVSEVTEAAKGKRKRRRNKRVNENAVQQCVFEKLGLLDSDGAPVQEEIVKLIDSYTGDAEGKNVMKRMSQNCMDGIESVPAKRKANVLITCVKASMQDACKVHDLKKVNPSLSLMVAKKTAERCLAGVELPPKMVWSRVRCSAEEMRKFAEARLAAMAPARKRRSPKKGKGPKPADEAESEADSSTGNSEADASVEKTGSSGKKGKKGKASEEADDTESDANDASAEDSEASSDEGTKGGSSGRRKGGPGQRKGPRDGDMQDDKAKLEALVGPLDEALKAAGAALQEADQCTFGAMGLLNEDDSVNVAEVKKLLSAAEATPKVKEALLGAVEACSSTDASAGAFAGCVNRELTITCPAAASADDRKEKAERRAQRPKRRRPSPQAGRPPKVSRPRIPAALRRQS
ncbi:uncharacterized protein LOC122386005 [Amphibalanus amphitrite]|uniref:uncharacterized protein LOC122386005 n=1 Tax=Amphibalanus amphitrite TaxID=1232801 RepID=UPI001C90E482|nr:uncharacterized protein LOC122386005 [Amphibalanus amphitrite]